jgi:predicted enzyme related to lactoylglutathione lyase
LPQAWDWQRHVVDHADLHASDYDASVRFYATVLEPLGIPSWREDSDEERATYFTRVSKMAVASPSFTLAGSR